MTRLASALAVWMSLIASAPAAPGTPRTPSPRIDKRVAQSSTPQRPAGVRYRALGPDTPLNFEVTPRTEIRLNGEPCRYEEVPDDAIIVRLEVTADEKTALTIFFRTRK